MNIHHIGLISGFPMRVGWYGVLSPESWPASFRMIFPFKKKHSTHSRVSRNMEVQTWKFRKCWPLGRLVGTQPWVNPKVGMHTPLKVILVVTCQHPGLGQGSLNDPFEGGDQTMKNIHRF